MTKADKRVGIVMVKNLPAEEGAGWPTARDEIEWAKSAVETVEIPTTPEAEAKVTANAVPPKKQGVWGKVLAFVRRK